MKHLNGTLLAVWRGAAALPIPTFPHKGGRGTSSGRKDPVITHPPKNDSATSRFASKFAALSVKRLRPVAST